MSRRIILIVIVFSVALIILGLHLHSQAVVQDPGDEYRWIICHKAYWDPYNYTLVTKEIWAEQWPQHRNHGDSRGACE